MNRQIRVLVVDDLEEWREELVETLKQASFCADSASTVTQTLERLNEALYHLLILDIRLNDADPDNTDGIGLLNKLSERGLGEAMKVIILSAHGTQERMRTAFKDYNVAD